MTDNEKEAIEVLRRTTYFFTHISNLIKVKDDAWILITQSLSYFKGSSQALLSQIPY